LLRELIESQFVENSNISDESQNNEAADNSFGRETISDNNDSPGYLDSDTNVDSDSSVENLPILDKELAENFLMIWQSRY